MKTISKICKLLIAIILLSAGFGMDNWKALAQKSSSWSSPQTIPGYDDNTPPPLLIADQNRTVHAFTSQVVGTQSRELAIIYNQWTLEQGWTIPMDILLSPQGGQARLMGAFLDNTGMFHVIFFGGDETNASIYYSNSPAKDAANARSWKIPVLVGDDAYSPSTAYLTGDTQGNIVIIYGGRLEGNGVYTVYSSDGGSTWSKPEPIYLTYNDELWPFSLQTYSSPTNQIYAVWYISNRAGQGESVYFSKLDITKKKWLEPHELAKGSGLGVGYPTVIESNGELVVSFYNYSEGLNTDWLLFSQDDGQTWSNPVRIAPEHTGMNGHVAMAVDTNNILHLIFGERTPGPPDIHGMWHTTLQNNRVEPVEAIISGPRVIDITGNRSFDPSFPRIVISQGNVLLATWRQDPGLKENGVWYSYKILDAPELPLATLPAVSIHPTSTSTAPADLLPLGVRATPTPSFPEQEPAPSNINANPSEYILIGIVPSFVIILTLLFRNIAQRKKHE